MTVMFFAENDAMLNALPKPVKANKAMPSWLKDMPASHGYANTTVKKCTPFLDAMSLGYIIPMWCDLVVTINEDGSINLVNPPTWGGDKVISDHSAYQIEGSPFAGWKFGSSPMKLNNPWVIQTDPGVSCLITEPLNQPNETLRVFSGVVDTDTYYNNINFPFLIVGKPGEHVIRKGTPIAQVVPFRRQENATPFIGIVDKEHRQEVTNTLGTQFRDGYKQHYRHKRAESRDE